MKVIWGQLQLVQVPFAAFGRLFHALMVEGKKESKVFLETLILRVFNKFSLDQDFSDIDVTCSTQLPVFEIVRPSCLWK